MEGYLMYCCHCKREVIFEHWFRQNVPIRSKFWWKPMGPLPYQVNEVSDLRKNGMGFWNHHSISSIYDDHTSKHVLQTLYPFLGGSDWLARTDSAYGFYSVKAGYHLLNNQTLVSQNDIFPWEALWRLPLPRRVLVFLWKLYHYVIPCRLLLQERNIKTSLNYPFCQEHTESINHVFIRCNFAKAV